MAFFDLNNIIFLGAFAIATLISIFFFDFFFIFFDNILKKPVKDTFLKIIGYKYTDKLFNRFPHFNSFIIFIIYIVFVLPWIINSLINNIRPMLLDLFENQSIPISIFLLLIVLIVGYIAFEWWYLRKYYRNPKF